MKRASTGKLNAFSSLAAELKGIRRGLSTSEAQAAAQLVDEKYRVQKIEFETTQVEFRAQALITKEANRQRNLALEKTNAEFLARPLPEQCNLIRQDGTVYLDLPRNLLKTEHVQAAIAFARTHLARQLKSIDRQDRVKAQELWSGQFIVKILKKAPTETHTPEMVIQAAIGRTRLTGAYTATSANAGPAHVIKSFLDQHPLLDDALAQRLVRTNPWLIFSMPEQSLNANLESIAESELRKRGLFTSEIDHYSQFKRRHLSLEEFINLPIGDRSRRPTQLSLVRSFPRVKIESQSKQDAATKKAPIRAAAVAAKATVATTKVTAAAKAAAATAKVTAAKAAAVAAKDAAAKNECDFAAARSVIVGSTTLVNKNLQKVSYQLLYDQKARCISLIHQQGDRYRLYDCVLKASRESTMLMVSYRDAAGYTRNFGTGLIEEDKIEFDLGDMGRFSCDVNTESGWLFEPPMYLEDQPKLIAHRVLPTHAPHNAANDPPDEVEVEDGLTAEDLNRLRGDVPMNFGCVEYARQRG